jgi:hypothetical protein
MGTLPKSVTVDVVVDAPLDDVWAVVSDPTRVGEWSQECQTVRWIDGSSGPAVGARFAGESRLGRAGWRRIAEVVAFDPPRSIAWKTIRSPLHRDSTRWQLDVEPCGDGTRITQRYELEIGALLDRILYVLVKPHRDRRESLAEDLRRIGDVARSRRTASVG